jgi:hypothetical protein
MLLTLACLLVAPGAPPAASEYRVQFDVFRRSSDRMLPDHATIVKRGRPFGSMNLTARAGEPFSTETRIGRHQVSLSGAIQDVQGKDVVLHFAVSFNNVRSGDHTDAMTTMTIPLAIATPVGGCRSKTSTAEGIVRHGVTVFAFTVTEQKP